MEQRDESPFPRSSPLSSFNRRKGTSLYNTNLKWRYLGCRCLSHGILLTTLSLPLTQMHRAKPLWLVCRLPLDKRLADLIPPSWV